MQRHHLHLILCSLLLAGCSEQSAPEKAGSESSHPWKGQVETLKEAERVSRLVNEQQRRKEERLNNLD